MHVTCSAIAVAADGQAIQIKHRTLNRWLFPGGHLEPHDTSLLGAAHRELAEETGLAVDAIAASPANVPPIAIDVHPIPDNPAKGEPDHFHADFCFLVNVSSYAVQLQLDEVTDWRWINLDEVDHQRFASVQLP